MTHFARIVALSILMIWVGMNVSSVGQTFCTTSYVYTNYNAFVGVLLALALMGWAYLAGKESMN